MAAGVALFVILMRTLSLPGFVAWVKQASVQQLTVFLFAPIYLAFLFYLDTTKNAGMSTRLLAPLVPFIAMTMGRLVEVALKTAAAARRILLSASTLLVVSFAAGQQLSFAEYRVDAACGLAVAHVLGQLLGEETLLQKLRSCVSEAARLLSAQPQIVNLFLKRPLLGLPTDYFNTEHTIWADDRTLNYAGRFGVRYVLQL